MADKSSQILVAPGDFPNHNITDAEKSQEEYGLKVARAIQYEWFNKNDGNCRYYNQRSQFHLLRLYARGEQPVKKYKDMLAINGDVSQLNVDWKPVPIIPKFADMMTNGMNDRLFTPKANAEDIVSSRARDAYKRNIENDMIAKDFLMQTKEEFGIDAFNVDPGQLPETPQELQLHMQLDYKPGIEIAAETAISTVFNMNDFEDVKYRFNKDQVELGIGIVKHEYSYDEGIKLKYVDPENTIHSYTEDIYFGDVFYWGEVVKVPILELKHINPTLTDEDIEEIKQLSTSWSSEYSLNQPYGNSIFDKDTVNVLYFNYKDEKNFVYKKKNLKNGGSRVIRKDINFNPSEDDQEYFTKVDKKLDVWYEGALILGSNKLIKWELSENMVRPEAAFNKSYSNYVAVAPKMYKGSYDSPVRRMTSFADQIQVTHIKMQQVLQKIVPDGVFIDADGINEVDLGNGGTYSPQAALDLYFATGSVIGRSYTGEGEFNNARVPISELNSSSGQSKLISLANTYDYYLNMIRDVTGLNAAADASSPDPNSLVGLQKMAALNSNVATRHILDASLFMTRRMAECVSYRISDILNYSDDKEEFANQIGGYNMDILDDIKSLPLHSFGIFIEVSPDEEEKAELEGNIQLALQSGGIELEDAIDVRAVSNMKLATELLKLKRKKKKEADQAYEMQKIQAQEQANQASAQAAAQAKMQAIQMEAQAKVEIQKAETAGKIETLKAEASLKKELMATEFEYNMTLKNIDAQAAGKRETEKEDRKDKRIDKQSTQQSEMIEQRQTGKPPVRFESSEDTLDGLGFEQFG